MMMMPIYPGAPWLPKFHGPNSDIKYGDWKEQMCGILNSQNFTEPRKVELLMGALAGEAKLQINVLDTEERDTSAKIFTCLNDLYGDNTSVAVLRSQFFGCVQKPNESVKTFTLRLRDLYRKLQRHIPDDAPSERSLQDQMLLGLREGPLSQTLRTYVRRNPDLDFAAVHSEALLLEEEQRGQGSIDTTCSAAVGESRQYAPPTPSWREALKQEILNDVKDQMKGLTQEIINEIKPLIQHSGLDHFPMHHRPRPRPRFQSSSDEWTSDGKPICRQCKQAGHVARFCRNHRTNAPNTPPLN